MAIKYLDAKRLQGTNAERLALTSAGLGSAVDGTNQGTTTTSNTPIYNQTSGGALDGESPVGFKFKLHVNGATTGNLVGQIRSGVTTSSHGSNQLTSSNSIDLSTIQDTTSFQTLTFDGSYELGTNSDEAVLIYWSEAESNGSSSIWIALRWSSETANTADVISTTNDGVTSNTNFEFWTAKNTNGKILTSITYPSLLNGTIFNETDTYKYFMFDGTDTWNQMVSS